MAGTLVQYATCNSYSGSPNPITCTLSGVQAGNVLIVVIAALGAYAFTVSIFGGNNWGSAACPTLSGIGPGGNVLSIRWQATGSHSGTETFSLHGIQDSND